MSHQISPPPAGGWVCFHCGQACRTVGEAELHFGVVANATQACRLAGTEFSLLQELRKVELERDETLVRLAAARLGLDGTEQDEAVERFRAGRGIGA